MDLVTSFDKADIVKDVRTTGNGSNFLIEAIKFVFVIAVADALTNRAVTYVINHDIEPFAGLNGIWLIGIGLLSIVAVFYCILWEKMRPRHLGLRVRPFGKTGRDLVFGYLFGALLMSAAVLDAVLLGGLAPQTNLKNAIPTSVLLIFLIYLFQAFGEEVLYRGAFMMSLVRRNSPLIALAVSSLFFSLHHHFNGGYGPVAFVNLFLLAVILGITVFLTNRIWMATTIHAAWNFFQGNVFGTYVSGTAPDLSSTLVLSPVQGNPLIYGGAMGLEGSIVTTVVLLAALAGLAVFSRRSSTKRQAAVRQGC